MSDFVTRGMRLQVLRPADGAQFTKGPSSRATELTVIGTVRDGDRAITPIRSDCRVFDPTVDAPAVALHVRSFGRMKTVSLVPVTSVNGLYEARQGVMAGGNFAHSHDSRISELIESLLGERFYGALSVHDRMESAEGPLVEV